MEQRLLRQRLRLAYGLTVAEARTIPLSEAVAMLVRCKKLKLPYNHSEVVKGYRIYYNITKTVRLRGKDYHTLLMGNPTKAELVKYATLIKGARLRKDMKKAQMKAAVLKALGKSGVTEPTAIRAVRARILRKGGKPVKPLAGETPANTVRVFVTKAAPKRNTVKPPNNNSLVLPKPVPKPGEEVKPMNVSLPTAPAAAPAAALKPVNVNPFDAKPVNNGRTRLMGMPIPGTGSSGPVVTVTGGVGGNRNRNRNNRPGLIGGMGNLKIAKNLFGGGNSPANKRAELNFKLEMEKLKNARNAAKTQNERGALNREIEAKKKIMEFKKNTKVNEIETVNSVINEMREFLTPRALRKLADNTSIKFNNNPNSNNDRQFIVERVRAVNSKKKKYGIPFTKMYSNEQRERARELLKRYRTATRGKKVLNTVAASNELAGHQKKRNANPNYKTNTFLRFNSNLNSGENVSREALLNAVKKGKIMSNEYNKLAIKILNKKEEAKEEAKAEGSTTTNSNKNNNNNKELVAKMSEKARTQKLASTKRRENMYSRIEKLKEIKNAQSLNAAKNKLRSNVNAGTFTKKTKTRMRSSINNVRLNTPTSSTSSASAPTNNNNNKNKNKNEVSSPTPTAAAPPTVAAPPTAVPRINNSGNNSNNGSGNQAKFKQLLNDLESGVLSMSRAQFGGMYKNINTQLKNTSFNELKASLRRIGMQRAQTQKNFDPTAFNNSSPISTRLRSSDI